MPASICTIVPEKEIFMILQDSISENETFSYAADDFPSSPTCDIRDNNKYQEEYESPVSVLGHFFAEDSSSPSNVTFQSGKKQDPQTHTLA